MIQIATQDRIPADQNVTALTAAEAVIAATQAWIEKAVIGLNLCPFAKAVYIKSQIRYAVSAAQTAEELLADFVAELKTLESSDPAEHDTTVLIHPEVLNNFLDYNDFLDITDEAIVRLKLDGEIQIASFHPDYQFAGSAPTDIDNYTNRSPYPTLHLLREASIERAIAVFPDASEIYDKNIETLRRIGLEGWHLLGLSPIQNRSGKK